MSDVAVKKVPELRFVGFNDVWDFKSLSEVSSHRGGTAIEKYFSSLGVYKVISIGSYSLNSTYVDQGIRAISNNITDKYVVRSGELTMVLNDKTHNGSIIGRTLLISDNDKYVVNQRTEIIHPTGDLIPEFAYVSLNNLFRNKVKRIVQGGTQIYVNYRSVENLTVGLPRVKEQEKIGTFFEQLDKLITLQQRKIDLLKKQKQGYLQKMFPKAGGRVPELRFAGFSCDWKNSKLGEVVQIIMGQSPSSKNYTNNPNDHILVQGNADMNKGYVVPRVWTTQVTKKISSGAILLSVRAPVGDVGITNYDIVLGRGVSAFKGNNFIFQQLLEMKSRGYWRRYSTGSTFESINSEDIKNASLIFPSMKEQEKIGSFFKQFDKNIQLQSKKLDSLKELKKGFLQKMFV